MPPVAGAAREQSAMLIRMDLGTCASVHNRHALPMVRYGYMHSSAHGTMLSPPHHRTALRVRPRQGGVMAPWSSMISILGMVLFLALLVGTASTTATTITERASFVADACVHVLPMEAGQTGDMLPGSCPHPTTCGWGSCATAVLAPQRALHVPTTRRRHPRPADSDHARADTFPPTPPPIA